MTTLRIAALVLLFLAGGCRGTAEQLVPMPAQDVAVTRGDLTRIYMVRSDDAGLEPRATTIFDGETEIGSLTPDTFLCWERPGGRRVGRAIYQAVDWSRGKREGVADLDCEAGHVYYFGVSVNREEAKPSVALLDAAQGEQLVAKCRPAHQR